MAHPFFKHSPVRFVVTDPFLLDQMQFLLVFLFRSTYCVYISLRSATFIFPRVSFRPVLYFFPVSAFLYLPPAWFPPHRRPFDKHLHNLLCIGFERVELAARDFRRDSLDRSRLVSATIRRQLNSQRVGFRFAYLSTFVNTQLYLYIVKHIFLKTNDSQSRTKGFRSFFYKTFLEDTVYISSEFATSNV